MDFALRIVIGLMSVLLSVLGLKAMFAPGSMIVELGVEPSGPRGLNTIRGDVGGVMVGSAIMMILGLALQDTAWFLAVAVLMAVVAIGRVAGLAMDGMSDAVKPTVVELVLIAVLVAAHLRFG